MTNAARIRILSVDEHPLFREGIGAIINCQPDMTLVGTASKGAEAIEAFRALRPDEETVEVYLKHIMNKLRGNDRTESVAIAARRGIIRL